jgi:trehalose 6-phosphate phosphatase
MLQDALELVDQLRTARAAAGLVLLGLDFDGTLAPIVPRPEDAALPAALRPLLHALAARPDTVIALVSGRGLRDLADRVAMPDIYYAGNHGLEIEGPGVHRVHEAARAAADLMAATARRLETELAAVAGVIVEDKGLTLSVHYRLVGDDATAGRVRDVVRACTAGAAGIRITHGKKVVEIRPDVDWHKGRALDFLRASLTADHPGAPTVFVGDDRTDEDAFRAVGDDGWGIIVGDPPPPDTAARAALPSTAAVAEFLRRLL